jgi:hypothetical protein
MMMLRESTRSFTQRSRLYCSSSHVPNSATVPLDYLSLKEWSSDSAAADARARENTLSHYLLQSL